jgi:transposase-like protein
MVVRDVCPRCQSPKYKKNGHIHNGKQNHHCHDCGRQFVQIPPDLVVKFQAIDIVEII